MVGIFSEDEHHFGEQGFGCYVIAREDTGFHEVEGNGVKAHFHGTGVALRLVDNDDSPFYSCFEFAIEPFIGRCVSGAEGLEDHTF